MRFTNWESMSKAVEDLAGLAKEAIDFKVVKRDSWEGLTPLLAYSLTTSPDTVKMERVVERKAIIEFMIFEDSGIIDKKTPQDRAMKKAIELEKFLYKESDEVLSAPTIQSKTVFDINTMKRDPRESVAVTYEVFYGNE